MFADKPSGVLAFAVQRMGHDPTLRTPRQLVYEGSNALSDFER